MPLSQPHGNGTTSTPSPVAYTSPHSRSISPNRPIFSAASPLMSASTGKSGAQAACAAVPPASTGACTQAPNTSEMHAQHAPSRSNVTSSTCRSHASALDNTPHPMHPREMNGPEYEHDESTLPRLHEPSYEDQMKLKCLAYPFARPTTIRIGDVGVFAPNGTFFKHFNICEPSEMPPYFIPMSTPLRTEDVSTFFDFDHHTYLTTDSISHREEFSSGNIGARFTTSAADGAILALPAGAVRTELRELSKFREFVTANMDNFARYWRGMMLQQPELRLITGQLSAPYWGIATFSENTDRNLTLLFNQTGIEKDSKYTWTAPSFVKTSVSGKLRFSRPSDTVAVMAYTISPRDGVTGKPANKSSVDGGLPCREVGPSPHHVCDSINDRLLKMTKAKIAMSHDRDWVAVLTESDKTLPSEPELIKRVFAANEIGHDEGVTYLRWKAKRAEAATPADLLKDIDKLRDTLDEVGESDLAKRADILHSITENILTYLRISKNRDPRDSNFLLSIAVTNVTEEVKIMNDLRQQRASTLHLFASTMWARFMTGGDVRFMDQAISYFQKALGVDNRHEASMFELATALWMRFTRYNQLQDLNEVVMLYRALLFNRSPNNSNVVEWLNGIGLALWERYKRTKAMNDMDHAISYLRRASVSYPVPCDPFTLSNLGNILMAKARAFKDTSESDEAIACYRKALNTVTPLHPNRSAFLSNLGDALCYRYERRFVLADLNEAIRCYERALELPAPHHRDRVASLKLCADKLHLRYNRTADVEDLELAVKHYQEAKRQAHPQHPKYASVTEALILAQRDLENYLRHRSDYASPPPSSQSSPVLEHSPVPMLRPTSWSTTPVTHPVASTTPYRTVPKYRIVSRSHTMKPYSRPRRDSSSESESGNARGFHHHRVKSPAPKSPLSSFNRSPQHHPKRHHTMPGMPTGLPL